MSKKKIIVGIMGTTALITGDGVINTVASVPKVEKTIEEDNKKSKKDKSKIRIKRENLIGDLIGNSFVEKIYDSKNNHYELSLVLDKKISLMIIKIIIESHKLDIIAPWSQELKSIWKTNSIEEIKKIIKDIKNNSINLSAQEFDENAIDAFAHTIWKNFIKYCDLFLKLGINQKNRITLYIENNKWIINDKELFQIFGEKTEWEKNETNNQKIKEYSHLKNISILEYAIKIISNEENKRIEFKYQNDDSITGIFTINYIKKFLKFINDFKDKNISFFQELFIKDVNDYINSCNFFSNKIIPSSSEINKISKKIIDNKNKYNSFFRLKNEKEKIAINSKNNKDKFVFKNHDDYQNSFVEKLYDFNNKIWILSLVLSKNNWKRIFKIFTNNIKETFILETKKIITDVKNNSINLSAQEFDENAIDAFAHTIWKNFSNYYNLIFNLGINQQLKIRLEIKNNEFINDNSEIIGKNTKISKERKNIKNNIFQNCQMANEIVNKGNSVEHSTSSKIKIKINKITWARIAILFFLIKDKNNFIDKIRKLFVTFPPSYNDNNYKLNYEEMKSFAYLIWKNFSFYHEIFFKLKNDELIRIISYTGYPEGYWTSENFYDYNEIVDKNNEIIDWKTFNEKKIRNVQKEKKISHDQDFDVFKRKKRPNHEPQPGTSKEDLKNVIKNIFLGELENNSDETILAAIAAQNPWVNTNQLQIEMVNGNTVAVIPRPNSNYYRNFVNVYIQSTQQHENVPLVDSESDDSESDDDLNIYLSQSDLNLNDNIMFKPMEEQLRRNWCTISVLQNILNNNKGGNELMKKFSQEKIANFFEYDYNFINLDEKGLFLESIFDLINKSKFINKNVGFDYYHLLINNNFFNLLTSHDLFNILQNLIWQCLSRNTPVTVGYDTQNSQTKETSGHSILIVGIEPNENPFKTLYLIRDPSVNNNIFGREVLPDGTPNIERAINAKDLFFGKWKNIINYVMSDLLINKEVYKFFFSSLLNDFDNFVQYLLNQNVEGRNNDILIQNLREFIEYNLIDYPQIQNNLDESSSDDSDN